MPDAQTKKLIFVLANEVQGTEHLQLENRLLRQTQQTTLDLGETTRSYFRDMHQGLFNVVSGLEYLKGISSAVASHIASVFNSSVQATRDFEVAMHRVAVVMGYTGQRKQLEGLRGEYEGIQGAIGKLALETEFTSGQIAEAFERLKQAGFSSQESNKLMDYTSALVTASANEISMASAADVARMSVSALNSTVEGIPHTLDMLLRATTLSAMRVRDIPILLESLRTAAAKFKATRPSELIAINAILMQMGRSAAEAGLDVNNLARSYELFLRSFLVKGKGVRGGRIKLMGAKMLGLTKEDFIDANNQYRNLIDVIYTVTEKVAKARGRLGDQVFTYLQSFFGSSLATNIFIQAERYREKYHKTLRGFVSDLEEANGEVKDAQANFLESSTGIMEVLDGSIEQLKRSTLGLVDEGFKPLYKSAIQAVNALGYSAMDYPRLAKAISYVTGAVGALAFALTGLMGVFISVQFARMALSWSAAQAASNIKIGTLMITAYKNAVMGAYHALKGYIVGFAALGAAIGVMYVLYKKNIFGFGDWVKAWVKDISNAIDALSLAVEGKGIPMDKWLEMSFRSRELTKNLYEAYLIVKELWEGIKTGITPFLEGIVYAIGGVVKGLTTLIDLVWDFGAMLGFWVRRGEAAEKTFNILGIGIGGFLGILLSIKTLTKGWGLFSWLLGGKGGVTAATGGVMGLFSLIKKGYQKLNPYKINYHGNVGYVIDNPARKFGAQMKRAGALLAKPFVWGWQSVLRPLMVGGFQWAFGGLAEKIPWGRMWDGMKAGGVAVWGAIERAAGATIDAITGMFKRLDFSGLWSGAVSGLGKVGTAIAKFTGLSGIITSLSTAFTSLWASIAAGAGVMGTLTEVATLLARITWIPAVLFGMTGDVRREGGEVSSDAQKEIDALKAKLPFFTFGPTTDDETKALKQRIWELESGRVPKVPPSAVPQSSGESVASRTINVSLNLGSMHVPLKSLDQHEMVAFAEKFMPILGDAIDRELAMRSA